MKPLAISAKMLPSIVMLIKEGSINNCMELTFITGMVLFVKGTVWLPREKLARREAPFLRPTPKDASMSINPRL